MYVCIYTPHKHHWGPSSGTWASLYRSHSTVSFCSSALERTETTAVASGLWNTSHSFYPILPSTAGARHAMLEVTCDSQNARTINDDKILISPRPFWSKGAGQRGWQWEERKGRENTLLALMKQTKKKLLMGLTVHRKWASYSYSYFELHNPTF